MFLLSPFCVSPSATSPFSSLLLSKANSTSTGQLDKLVSPGLSGLTPDSEEERSLPPQRVSTFRPRPYSMADSNKVTPTPQPDEDQHQMWKVSSCFLPPLSITDHLRLVLSSTISNQVTPEIDALRVLKGHSTSWHEARSEPVTLARTAAGWASRDQFTVRLTCHFGWFIYLFYASRINPFAHIRLRKTVTNDRSAPIIEWPHPQMSGPILGTSDDFELIILHFLFLFLFFFLVL